MRLKAAYPVLNLPQAVPEKEHLEEAVVFCPAIRLPRWGVGAGPKGRLRRWADGSVEEVSYPRPKEKAYDRLTEGVVFYCPVQEGVFSPQLMEGAVCRVQAEGVFDLLLRQGFASHRATAAVSCLFPLQQGE
jgi:hypothetical protein